jgi:acyl carrier protein
MADAQPQPARPGIEHLPAVTQIIEDHLGTEPGKVQLDSRFAEDLQADSLDAIELTMAVEERFSIVVSDDEAEAATTVAELLALIAGKKAGVA